MRHFSYIWSLCIVCCLLAAPCRGAMIDDFQLDANGSVFALVETHDGSERSWVVAGSFTLIGGHARERVARLREDLSVDPDFNFAVTGGSVWCVAVDDVGRILIGGTFTHVDGAARNRMARFVRSGGEWLLDEFNPNFGGAVRAIAIPPAGPIYVCGSFTSVGGTPQARIAKLDPITGIHDPAFDPRPSADVYAMALDADGRLVIAGEFTSLQPGGPGNPSFTRGRVARLDPNGSVDAGFNPNANSWVSNVLVQPDGRILLGGAFTSLRPNNNIFSYARGRIARVHASGLIDSAFNPGTTLNNGNVDTIALAANGHLLVGGNFTIAGGSVRDRLVLLDGSGGVLTHFTQNMNSTVRTAHFAISPEDGAARAWVAGEFTSIGSVSRSRIARIAEPGGAASSDVDRIRADPDDPLTLVWERGGYAPAFATATLERSNGAGWEPPLHGVLVGTNWHFPNLAEGSTVRLTGHPLGGFHSASPGLHRRVASHYLKEPFHFPTGTSLAGTGLWREGGMAGPGGPTPVVLETGSLHYPGLRTGTGNRAQLATPNAEQASGYCEHPVAPIVIGDGREIWLSFLIRVQGTLPGDAVVSQILAVGPDTGTDSDKSRGYLTRVGAVAGHFRLGITRGGGSNNIVRTPNMADGETHMVAVRYRRTDAANRSIAVWINPSPASLGRGNAPDAPPSLTLTGTAVIDHVETLALHPVDVYVSVQLDELRLGRSWASVSPPAPVDTLAAWAVIQGIDLTNSPPLTDLAGEGLTLTQKFAFNLDPLASVRGPLTEAMLDPGVPVAELAGLPVPREADGNLQLYFVRPSPGNSDLDVRAEFHTDPAAAGSPWLPAGFEQVRRIAGGYELVMAVDPFASDEEMTKLFGRVRVQQLPAPDPATLALRWKKGFAGTELPEDGIVELEFRPPPDWDGQLTVAISLDGETWSVIDPGEVFMEPAESGGGYWRIVARRPPAGRSYHFRVSHMESDTPVESNVLGPVFVPEVIPYPSIHLVSEWILNDPFLIVGQARNAVLHISHPDGVKLVALEIRKEGATEWTSLGPMQAVGDEYFLEFSVAKEGIYFLRAQAGYGAGSKKNIAASAIYGPICAGNGGAAGVGPVIVDLLADPPLLGNYYEPGTEIEFQAEVEDDGGVKEVHVYAAGNRGVKLKPQPDGFPVRLRRPGDREREKNEGVDPEDFGIQSVDTSGNLFVGSVTLPALSVEQLVALYFVVEATDFEGHVNSRHNDTSWRLRVRPLSPLGGGSIRSPQPQLQLEPGSATLLEPGEYVTFPSSSWPIAEFSDMTPVATDTGRIRVNYSDLLEGERIEIVRIADGRVIDDFVVPAKSGTVEFICPPFYFRNEDYKPTLLTVPEKRRIREGGPLSQEFRNAYFLRLTDVGGQPVNAGPAAGRRDFRVGQPAFHWQNFTELDYGFYWYKDMHHGLKADPNPYRYQNLDYFDPTKPTVIYIHGWAPKSSLAGYRENFHFRHAGGFRVTNGFAQTDIQNPESCVEHACTGPWNLLKYWKQAGYNVGIFYWNPFSDEEAEGIWPSEKPYRAEAKLWTTTGPKRDGKSIEEHEGMRCRVRIPNALDAQNPDMQFLNPYSEEQAYYPIPAGMNVSDLFRQEYAIAFAGIPDSAPDKSVHLVGHSTGAGLVITGAFAVHRHLIHNPGLVLPRPNRLTMLDAFLSENDKLIENRPWLPMRRARSMYRQMAGIENPQGGQYDPGIALEYVESSYIISHGASHDAKYMWNSAAHIVLKPDWIANLYGNVFDKQQETAIHMEAIRWYFMSKGFHSTRPRSGHRGWFMWEPLEFNDYPAPSASISRTGILRYMPDGDRGSTKYEITGGNFTFRSTDDEFQSRSR
jgi:hypothetical protein